MWLEVRDVEDASRRLAQAAVKAATVGGGAEPFDLERLTAMAWILRAAMDQLLVVALELEAELVGILTAGGAPTPNGDGWTVGDYRIQMLDRCPVISNRRAQ